MRAADRSLRRASMNDAGAPCSSDQPPGVPPLELTGERTLPDVPEENYWYRRHLAVYEWIAARVRGLRRRRPRLRRGLRLRRPRRTRAPRSSASTPTRRPTSTRGFATGGPNLRFERGLVEQFEGPCDAVVFLQTIEHVHDPGALLRADRRGGADRVHLHAQPADARAAGRREVRATPGTCASTRLEEYRALLEPRFSRGRDPRPLPRPQAAPPRAGAARRLGPGPPGAADHQALLRPLRARRSRRSDFPLRDGEGARARARLPGGLPCLSAAGAARAAISRSSSTRTCPTSRASAPIRSARSGSSTRSSRSYLPVLERRRAA